MAPRTETRLGVCNLCEAICGLQLTLTDGRVTGVRGNPDDPLSRGHICPKGVAIADVYDDPDRLRRPVRRVVDAATGETTWQRISWDEAFDLAADGLAAAVNTHGRNALGIYLGNPNAHSLGSLTHGVALVKSFRTRNKFSATSVDQLPQQFVGWQMFGHQLLLPIPDLDRTSYFLVFGGNPMASNGSLMTAPDFPNRLRALKKRGGRMVVVDPRRTETAKVATEHLFVRPGTDAFVLLAMLNVLFDEGLARPASYVKGVEAVRAAIADFTPERAEQHSGVAAADVRRLAREFAGAESAAAYGRVGVSTQEFGSVCHWAVNLLNVLTGNLDREGGAMFTRPAVDMVGRGLMGRGHHDVWRSRVRGLPEFGGELPVSVLREEIETPGEGQIRAMLTLAGNPVLSTPDGAGLDRALAGLDFMVAVDIYVNETTRHADVILPPTTCSSATTTTWSSTCSRCATPPGSRPRCSEGGGRPARLGDLPRAGAAHRRPAGHEEAAEEAVARAGQVPGQSDRDPDRAPRHLATYDDARPAPPTRRRRPRSADARAAAGAAADEGPPRRRRTRAGAGRPRPAARGARTRGGRADPGRPAAPARQQLVDAQHRAAHRWPPAAPPAHAPRRPLRARAHRRRAGARGLTGRRGRGRGQRDRRHDARRGVPPPRLRAPGRRRPAGQRARGARCLDQRPHRPRAGRRQRQRGVQRRACDCHCGGAATHG
jgi:formylmethanofuran dehydrogenase subunit B